MLSPLPVICDLEELDGKSIVRTLNIEDKLYMILKNGEDQYLAVFHQTYDENVQVSVDVATDTVTLASGGNLFQIALAKVIEAASKGEHLEIDVGGNTVVVTGNPIPSINHFSMIDSDCGPAEELYEDKPRFKQPFKMRDRKTTAMLAKKRFR